MKKLSLILMVACLGIFATSCSSDKDPVPPADKDYAKEIASTYAGDLTVELPAQEGEEGELIKDKSSIKIEAAALNKVNLVLENFIINVGNNSLNVGTIKLTDVEVEGKDDAVNIKEKEFKDYALQNLPVKATILVKSGTVKGEELTNLVLHINDVFPPNSIIVKFDGVKGNTYTYKYDFGQDWVLEDEKLEGAEEAGIFTPSKEWGTSNIGSMFLQGITGVYTNVTQVKEQRAAKLVTLDSKGVNMWIMWTPKITPASLFLGAFDLKPALSGKTLEATNFGINFNKKPLALKGSYTYAAGAEFYRCPDPKKHQTAHVEEGTIDEGSINAILYDITENDAYLTGVDAYTSDRLVARAELNVKDQKEFTDFNVDFKFLDGKSFDKNKKYRIAVIASSSRYGDTFSGAPESTLMLRDIEIIAE